MYRHLSKSILSSEPAKELVKDAPILVGWEESQEQMDDESKIFVDKSLAITDRIRQIIEKKGIRQVDLAKLLDKGEPEISKWLAGMHNYTLRTISKLEAALDQSLIVIPQNQPAKESQPDAFLEWLDEYMDDKETWDCTSRLLTVREKYLSMCAKRRPEPFNTLEKVINAQYTAPKK